MQFIRYNWKFLGVKISFKIPNFYTIFKKPIYYKYLENKILQNKKNFVPITTSPYNNKNSVKPIAFYLPQFHATDLNNKNFGLGFTEWTNVTKAIPMFAGHNQPQLPIDVGFYDLSTDNVMYRQIELAKLYGIYGFCFHYYWFSGKRLLEKPIFNWLNSKELNFPFCLCWANENWSKLWDGGNKELIMKQELKDDDDEKFFYDILPFLKDDRYIKIDNKPVLLIYRLNLFTKERIHKFIIKIKDLALKEGLNGICICGVKSFDIEENFVNDVDYWVEFPPHQIKDFRLIVNHYFNKHFTGDVIDIEKYIKDKKYVQKDNQNLFKGCFPSWDNTARKALSNANILTCRPIMYKEWLKNLIIWTKKNHSSDKQFIFINAWNEWAEGAHLEPETNYGYAYLQATKDALEETDSLTIHGDKNE